LNIKDKDYFLFIKSLVKSQMYDPSLKRILKSMKSFNKRNI